MIRSLCTADWQIGMKAAHAGEKAKVVRQKRFEMASCIVELAKQKDVDFVLLASDTFKHHNVDSAAMKRTVDTLTRPDPILVYNLPGGDRVCRFGRPGGGSMHSPGRRVPGDGRCRDCIDEPQTQRLMRYPADHRYNSCEDTHDRYRSRREGAQGEDRDPPR